MNKYEIAHQSIRNSKTESSFKDIIPSDNELKSRIEYALLLDPIIDSDSIEIEVSNREVSMKGCLDALWKKRKVKNIAINTKGVISIDDEIGIVPSRDYSDEEITHELEKAIDRRPVVSQDDVEVMVSDGEVTLEGSVPNWFTYSQVKVSSENTLGVTNVIDRIKIES